MSKKYFMYGTKLPVSLLENEAFVNKIKELKYGITNKIRNNLEGSFIIVGRKMYCSEDMVVPEIHGSIKILTEFQIDTILAEFNIEKTDRYNYYFIIEE
jgi:hypothetical protein